jgi:hypothetical protein
MVGVGGIGVNVKVAVGTGVEVKIAVGTRVSDGVEIDVGAQEASMIARIIIRNSFVFMFLCLD